MPSFIHYKFNSSLKYDTISFDGLSISIADLKSLIIPQKIPGRSLAYDLLLTNAQTNEAYRNDDDMIPKNSSVLVARVPIKKDRRGGRGNAGTRVRRAHGIPKSFMMQVSGPNVQGAMMTANGQYAVPTINAEAYIKGKKEKPPFVPDCAEEQAKAEAEKAEIKIQEELKPQTAPTPPPEPQPSKPTIPNDLIGMPPQVIKAYLDNKRKLDEGSVAEQIPPQPPHSPSPPRHRHPTRSRSRSPYHRRHTYSPSPPRLSSHRANTPLEAEPQDTQPYLTQHSPHFMQAVTLGMHVIQNMAASGNILPPMGLPPPNLTAPPPPNMPPNMPHNMPPNMPSNMPQIMWHNMGNISPNNMGPDPTMMPPNMGLNMGPQHLPPTFMHMTSNGPMQGPTPSMAGPNYPGLSGPPPHRFSGPLFGSPPNFHWDGPRDSPPERPANRKNKRSRSPKRRSRSPVRRGSRSPLSRGSRSPLKKRTPRSSPSRRRSSSRSPVRTQFRRSPSRRGSRSAGQRSYSRQPVRKSSSSRPRTPAGRRSRSPRNRRMSTSPARRSPLARRSSRSPGARRSSKSPGATRLLRSPRVGSQRPRTHLSSPRWNRNPPARARWTSPPQQLRSQPSMARWSSSRGGPLLAFTGLPKC